MWVFLEVLPFVAFCIPYPALRHRLPTMENELDQRLARLQLEQYRSITDRTANDCLFLVRIDRIREYAYRDKTRNKALIAEGEGHVDSVVQDTNSVDV
jgi:hypothetical protein